MRSNSLRIPLLVLVTLLLGLVGFVLGTTDSLPDRVATHFGAGGQADGWMTPKGLVQFLLLSAMGLSLFLHAVFALIRASNGFGCNIPHRDYWLAPERRQETLAHLQYQGAWLVCAIVAFLAGMHYVVLSANRHQPPALPEGLLATVAGGFLLIVCLWIGRLLLHFSRLPKST